MLVDVDQPQHIRAAEGERKVLDRPRDREARVGVLILGLQVVHAGCAGQAGQGSSCPHAAPLLCRTAGGWGSLPIDPFTRQRPQECHLGPAL